MDTSTKTICNTAHVKQHSRNHSSVNTGILIYQAIDISQTSKTELCVVLTSSILTWGDKPKKRLSSAQACNQINYTSGNILHLSGHVIASYATTISPKKETRNMLLIKHLQCSPLSICSSINHYSFNSMNLIYKFNNHERKAPQ